MRNRTIRSAGLVLASAILVLAQTTQTPASGQAEGRGGRRANAIPPPGPPHDSHDLSGTWMQFGPGLGGGGGGRPRTASEWSPGPLPLTPAGLAKLNSNLPGKGPRAGVPAKGNDPLSDANVPGLLRTLVYGR